ncbi:MAG: outer membrane lipoprotein-sorting protein [Bacteroidales bacterium]
MKKKMIITGLWFAVAFIASAQTEDASSILERSRELTIADAMEATITLTITDKNGATRVRTNTMVSKKYPDGTEKRLIRFVSPAEVQGTSILLHDYADNQDDMWIYLPALKRVRRIVSSEKGKSFMGSEFTNADISSPPSSDFISKHLAGSGTNDQYVIESSPTDGSLIKQYGYAKRISYFSKENLYLQKMEFFDRNGLHFKTIEVLATEPTGSNGKYMVSEMQAVNHQTGRSSSMKMKDISTSVKPADSLFDAQNLDR